MGGTLGATQDTHRSLPVLEAPDAMRPAPRTGHQTAVGVGGRIQHSAQGRQVVEDTSDEGEPLRGEAAQTFGVGQNIASIAPQAEVQMSTAAGRMEKWFGQKGGGVAVF